MKKALKAGKIKNIMKIVFLSKLSKDWEQYVNQLRDEFPGVEFIENHDPENRINVLKDSDAAIAGKITTEELENAAKLKAVIVPFTGLNNFPTELLKERNIKIYNTHANARYVAEHAVTLAFALLGKVIPFHNDLKKGIWSRTKETDDMWNSIINKNAGIMGYGHIGRHIAKYLKPFGVHITGFRSNPETSSDEFADVITGNFDDLIKNSEIIFNVLPLNPETKHIINPGNVDKFKGKYIITVGRGETIHEEALYNGLTNGIIKGAAIDVWYNYPGRNPEPVMPAKYPFWELPNVVMSPHKSSHTAGAVTAMIDDTCENIRKFIKTHTV